MSLTPSLHPGLLREVTDLNRRFITLLDRAASANQFALEPTLQAALRERLTDAGSDWPQCPFLLYSVAAHESAPAGMLLDPYVPDVSRLATITLGLLWQLARDNPPAACAVAGTDRAWCDALARLSVATLAELSQRVSLRPRLIDVPDYWQDMARQRGITALQRVSLGPAGMQLILSRQRRARVEREARSLTASISKITR